VSVGHVVSARLVAARLTEQLSESVRLAWVRARATTGEGLRRWRSRRVR